MITSAILLLLWNLRKKIPSYLSITLGLGLVASILAFIPKRPDKVVELPDGKRVKIRLKTAGFMDTGTSFDVYQKHSRIPFFRTKVGRAKNGEVDYLHLYPDFTLDIVDDRLIVHHGELADTLRIY